MEGMTCSKTLVMITSIQAWILCLANLSKEMQDYIPRIISNFNQKSYSDVYVTQIILEFLMRM